MTLRRFSAPRRGTAAVEFVVVVPLVLVLLFGIWDVGRIVEVQQLVSNAAREGARQAAVGTLLDASTGVQSNVTVASVQTTVTNYFTSNGIATNGLSVQYADVTNPGATQPYQAQHLDQLSVTVTLPFSNVSLLLVDKFVNVNTTALTDTVVWYSTQDISLNVNTTIPTN